MNTIISSVQPYQISPFQTLDQEVNSRNSATAQFAKQFFEKTVDLYTKISKFQKLKEVKYSKMSLYKFRQDDSMSSIAGRVALYFATFCTLGLFAGGLLLHDVARNVKITPDKKQEVCHIVDQLSSCVFELRCKVSDDYKKMTGKTREMVPLWKGEDTPSKELQRLSGENMYKAAMAIVGKLQIEIDMVKTHVEELARGVGREEKNTSSLPPSHVARLVEEFNKDISSSFQAKATFLNGDMEYINNTLENTKKRALKRGQEHFAKLANEMGKTLPELVVSMGGVASFETESLQRGYILLKSESSSGS